MDVWITLGQRGFGTPLGFFSQLECPQSAPGGPSNWLLLLGMIDWWDTTGRHLIV